jgi:hypothetical protein
MARDYLHLALFCALLGLAASAGRLAGCTADDAPVTPPADAAPDAAAPPEDATAAGDDAAPDAFASCGACWNALGYDSRTCATQPAAPFGHLSGYRTCGRCVALYTVAQCAAAGGVP